MTPQTLARQFDDVEQNETRVQPIRKLGAESICTSCRKEKHYGNCKRPIAIKRSDFNMGLTGDDPSAGDNPSTSPHYSSATSAISALARAQEGRPAEEQANTAFAQLHRINAMADQAVKESADVPSVGYGDKSVDRAWRSFDTVNDATCIEHDANEPVA